MLVMWLVCHTDDERLREYAFYDTLYYSVEASLRGTDTITQRDGKIESPGSSSPALCQGL